ncbi:unnamed protein product [Paramecium octaurelia]|uniref:Uncharacterized protein n=1 Tax=Paramecium octaurelia TaxID=43137 RepID=A0A8S1V9D0_PAROT|nr:unnamed protein product [Paramecium octaurelia]
MNIERVDQNFIIVKKEIRAYIKSYKILLSLQFLMMTELEYTKRISFWTNSCLS